MPSRFDGPGVLVAIGSNPAAFPALKPDIDATARKLLVKQIKAPALTLETLLKVVSVVGEAGLRIGLDEMTAKDLTTVARKLDPANPDVASLSGEQIGDHVCALGRGDIKPVAGKKAASSSPAKKPAKRLSKIGEVLNSEVHSGLPIGSSEPKKKAASQTRSKKSAS